VTDKLDRLWAPWRLEYIKSAASKPDGCFICTAIEAHTDRENLVLHRDELGLVMMNLYPYNNGHLLVAPYRHVGTLDELETDEITALGLMLRKAVGWLERAYKPNGYNIGMNLGRIAGAGLPGHLHYHIVPRWDGDTNFMPVLGCAKVISEGLASSYDQIKRAMEDKRGQDKQD
jgi:ATP adenylyltransferase